MRKLAALLATAGMMAVGPAAAFAAPPENRPPDNRPPSSPPGQNKGEEESNCDLGVIIGEEICIIEESG